MYKIKILASLSYYIDTYILSMLSEQLYYISVLLRPCHCHKRLDLIWLCCNGAY